MIGLLSSFWLRIKLGVMVAGAVAVAIFSAWRMAVNKGRADERAKQTERTLRNVQQRKEIENEAAGMSDDELDRANARWLRKHQGRER